MEGRCTRQLRKFTWSVVQSQQELWTGQRMTRTVKRNVDTGAKGAGSLSLSLSLALSLKISLSLSLALSRSLFHTLSHSRSLSHIHALAHVRTTVVALSL
jgi:hypothetical protein